MLLWFTRSLQSYKDIIELAVNVNRQTHQSFYASLAGTVIAHKFSCFFFFLRRSAPIKTLSKSISSILISITARLECKPFKHNMDQCVTGQREYKSIHHPYYYASQSFPFQLLFDLFLHSHSLSLIGCATTASFQPFPFFFSASKFENSHCPVTHQRSTNYSIYIRLRSSFYFSSSMENVLTCAMYHIMISPGDIQLHIEV